MSPLAHIIYLLLVLILVGPAALKRNRGMALRNAALWLAILVALVWLIQNFDLVPRSG